MMMRGAFDFDDPQVRDAWNALVPGALVLAYITQKIPSPQPLKTLLTRLTSPFKPFLTLEEAEALKTDEPSKGLPEHAPLWLTLALSWPALLEAGVWMGVAVFGLTVQSDDDENGVGDAWKALIMVLVWLYATIIPVQLRKSTPLYSLLIIYLVLLGGGILVLGGVLYDNTFSKLSLALQILNIIVINFLVVVVLSRPLHAPSKTVREPCSQDEDLF